ncbi:MAG: SPOR domain-containing protein [Nitrosospira sp.]|nr:SPOR domain-containing protein [Nitrosospira sp.]MDN5935790.1 SPOR domain-containing protein [Nitrosospira sp.]
MAKTVSEEEIQLRKRARRRLVGAVTLVIAAVVILPMVLDSKPEQRSQEIDIRIPPEDSVAEFTPGMAPRTDAPVTAPQERATGVQQEQRIKSESSVKSAQSAHESAEKPGVSGRSSDPSDPKVEPGTAKATAVTDAFVVQLGAFSDPVKARKQQQSLISKGIQVYTETLKTNKGEITRVRAGPFRTREEAEGAREKLKKLGLDGVVVDK